MSARVGCGQRLILVTPDVFEAWLVNENRIKTDLPNDSRFVRLWQKDDGTGYMLVFESSEWDELEEGEQIPLITPEIERMD